MAAKIIKKNTSIFSRLVLPFSCPSKFVGIHKSKRTGAACEDQQKYLRENIFGGNNMTSKKCQSVHWLFDFLIIKDVKIFCPIWFFNNLNLCRFEYNSHRFQNVSVGK